MVDVELLMKRGGIFLVSSLALNYNEQVAVCAIVLPTRGCRNSAKATVATLKAIPVSRGEVKPTATWSTSAGRLQCVC